MPLPIVPILGAILVALGIFGRRLGLGVDKPPATVIHNHYHGFEPGGSQAPPSVIEIDDPPVRRGKPSASRRRIVSEPETEVPEDGAELGQDGENE